MATAGNLDELRAGFLLEHLVGNGAREERRRGSAQEQDRALDPLPRVPERNAGREWQRFHHVRDARVEVQAITPFDLPGVVKGEVAPLRLAEIAPVAMRMA